MQHLQTYFSTPVIIMFVVAYLVVLPFLVTLYKILGSLPKENRLFPTYFIWLMLLPWIGIVFAFIMLVFGIPNSLKKTCANNQLAIQKAKSLQQIGWALMITTALSAITIPKMQTVNVLLAILGIILWIVYWIDIVKFKNTYIHSGVKT